MKCRSTSFTLRGDQLAIILHQIGYPLDVAVPNEGVQLVAVFLQKKIKKYAKISKLLHLSPQQTNKPEFPPARE